MPTFEEKAREVFSNCGVATIERALASAYRQGLEDAARICESASGPNTLAGRSLARRVRDLKTETKP